MLEGPELNAMHPARPIPLDLERTKYSYVERPNSVLIELLSGA